MATLRHLHHRTMSPVRRSAKRRGAGRAGRMATAVAALLALSMLGAPTASAAPADARSEHDRVAAEVADIEQRVRDAEARLEQMTLQAEEASGAVLAAQAALVTAQQHADAVAAELAAVQAAVERTQKDVATIGREAYMGGDDTFGEMEMVLHAAGPGELLQQAATLDILGEGRAQVLDAFEVAEAREARLDQEARAAVAERDAATRKAQEAQARADALLAEAHAEFEALTAEKAALDKQLRDAEIALLSMQGNADPTGTWAQREAAEQSVGLLSASGGGIAPTRGRVTSCYGARWGTMHLGLDIAAPIGTPVFSPEPGVVLQAGPASGFGLAVAIQHHDGAITVYGHINQFFVQAGQVVTAGQQIAEVGNRGQSSGPHLHFEVHHGSLYADRSNPVPWLAQRGVSLGGSCG